MTGVQFECCGGWEGKEALALRSLSTMILIYHHNVRMFYSMLWAPAVVESDGCIPIGLEGLRRGPREWRWVEALWCWMPVQKST
jgi:hypothetical protein